MTGSAASPSADGSKQPAPHPRFLAALADLGLADVVPRIRSFPDATRTAAEAAAAIGCELSQICKSLIFEADRVPVLVPMDGASRIDVDLVRREVGAGEATALVAHAGVALVDVREQSA